jgi:hypothetical protein
MSTWDKREFYSRGNFGIEAHTLICVKANEMQTHHR